MNDGDTGEQRERFPNVSVWFEPLLSMPKTSDVPVFERNGLHRGDRISSSDALLRGRFGGSMTVSHDTMTPPEDGLPCFSLPPAEAAPVLLALAPTFTAVTAQRVLFLPDPPFDRARAGTWPGKERPRSPNHLRVYAGGCGPSGFFLRLTAMQRSTNSSHLCVRSSIQPLLQQRKLHQSDFVDAAFFTGPEVDSSTPRLVA
jgi:hypothetical protein